MLFTLVRALAYATIFVGFLGVFFPARILQWAGFNAPALVMYGAVLAVVTHMFVIFYEERVLAEKFGPEYDAYRRDVGRWVPRL